MPVPQRENAYFVGVKLRSMTDVRMWYGERLATHFPMPVNSLCFTHCDSQPHAELYDPFDCMIFKVFPAGLDAIVDDAGAKHITELRCPEPGAIDPVIGHLAACLIPALDDPDNSCNLFVDTISRALTTHILSRYGGVKFQSPAPRRAALARWQEARVRDMVDQSLDGAISISDLANHCGLSVSHFSHAFKESTGISPYQYLIEQRLQRAKDLMLNTRLSLAEIAVSSGFGTQPYFSRRFLKSTGMSPGVWRRLHMTGKHILPIAERPEHCPGA
ncbi:helix-turn-helix domain-containing protein [Paraburkholderia fungorum]|uniref:helix-turn-helix domain-containing protein n=1 Tax=Paraburkholderia fungorum TaxID=134537 RepID=UPI00402B5668